MFRKLLLSSTALTLGTYGLTTFYFPELSQSKRQLFRATIKLSRLAYCGTKMAWIYSFGSQPTNEKHERASQILHTTLRRNGGFYVKLG